MIRGRADLKELTRILSDQRLVKLIEILEAVNPKAVKSNSRLIEV
jgi:CHASE2 domain-containing sensor protein